MPERAVVDRIEEQQVAVLLVGEQERELEIAIDCLPSGTREGTWLRVNIEGDRLVSAEIDPEQTRAATERIADKLAQLRNRGSWRRAE